MTNEELILLELKALKEQLVDFQEQSVKQGKVIADLSEDIAHIKTNSNFMDTVVTDTRHDLRILKERSERLVVMGLNLETIIKAQDKMIKICETLDKEHETMAKDMRSHDGRIMRLEQVTSAV